MRRSLRVATVQLRAHDVAAFGNAFSHIEQRVDEASAEAELVVLPEGTIPGYVLGFGPLDEHAIDEAVQRLRTIATKRGAVIVVGAAVGAPGALGNAGIVIDRDGSLAGRAEKLFLWHFDRRWFTPGDSIAPIESSLGRLGVLVCADGRMPEISRALVDRGAEILVMPTAWVSSGRNPDALENLQADVLGRVRAFENGTAFLAANKCGVEREMVLYCGKSQIVDSQGNIIAMADERDEAMLCATIEVGEQRPYRTNLAPPVLRRVGSASFRLAVSASPLPPDIDERLELLECTQVIAPAAPERTAALDDVAGVAVVGDAEMRDPSSLVTYRRAGYRFALWQTRGDAWTGLLALARAAENRIYVAVIDSSRERAFVVDPDGAVLCGAFDGYRLAACAIDLAKTAQTMVAPGTDVAEGIERIRSITAAPASRTFS